MNNHHIIDINSTYDQGMYIIENIILSINNRNTKDIKKFYKIKY